MEVPSKEIKNSKLNCESKTVSTKSSNPTSKPVVDYSAVKVLENLNIKISEAKKLVPGSKDTRNCYCSVQLDCEEIYKTHIVEKTVSPYFQEEFVFDIPHKFHLLCFYLHDLQDDVLSKRDTVFAKVVIKKSHLSNYNGVETWFPLSPVENVSEVQGQVYVEIKFQQSFTLSQNSQSEDSHKLCVKIPKCDGLHMSGGNCDPYVAVTIQGDRHRSDTKKSRARKANVNPSFDEEFVFELNKNNNLRRSWFDLSLGSNEMKLNEQEHWSSQVLKIAVYSAGTLGDVFMGEVRIPLSDIDHNSPHRGWYLLNPRADKPSSCGSKDEFGSLRIKTTYAKDIIFPSEAYNDLLNSILHSAKEQDSSFSWPTLIGAICGSRKQLKAAESLVHIFLHQGQLLNLILPLADDEIANAKNLNSIFRGSSFVSSIIEESIRVIGMSYLRNTFSSCMERIKSEAKSCEIDPSRLPQTNNASSTSMKTLESSSIPLETLHNNMLNLWEYVELIVSCIVNSSPKFPTLLSEIFTGLRNSATKHFPDDANVRYRVVTNFLFLRNFSSILLCPRKNKIIQEDLSQTTTRTFTLISKVLQNICNLSLPQQSASVTTSVFLKNFSSQFVKQQCLDSLRNYIDVVSSAPTGEQSVGQSSVEKIVLKEGLPASVRLNIDQDRALERLYMLLSNSVDNIKALQEECGARAVYVGPIATTSGVIESDGAESVDENESIPLPKQSSLNIRDTRQTFRTLCSILQCVESLDADHKEYQESVRHKNSEKGTRDRPYEGS